MKIELVGFSQGVSLEDKNSTINYLDFKKEDGTTFRLPVPEETMQELLKELYQKSSVVTEPDESHEPIPVPQPAYPPEATVFGGDGDEPDAVVMTPEQEAEAVS